MSLVVRHWSLGLQNPTLFLEVTMPSSFKDLRVWQEAMRLTLDIYRVTAAFPKHELYGLVSQMQRAAVSIPSNIAEGKGHQTNREFNHFLYHARGSLLELQTQVLIAKELEYLSEERAEQLNGRADGVGRALNGLIKAFRTENALPEGRETND